MTLLVVMDETIMWDTGQLPESKAVGSIKDFDTVRDMYVTQNLVIDPRFAELRRSRQGHASAMYHTIRKHLYADVLKLIQEYKAGKIGFERLKTDASATLRSAYIRLFTITQKLSATDQIFGRDTEKLVAAEEKDWIRSAIKQEMQYFNAFLDSVRNGMSLGKVKQRLEAYCDTLRSVYTSSRVLTAPSLSVIYWATKSDDRVCPSCLWLKDHSPYTKYTLPCVPRAGYTRCLNNCRCRILIKKGTVDDLRRLQGKALTMDWALRTLRDIKSGKRRYPS